MEKQINKIIYVEIFFFFSFQGINKPEGNERESEESINNNYSKKFLQRQKSGQYVPGEAGERFGRRVGFGFFDSLCSSFCVFGVAD